MTQYFFCTYCDGSKIDNLFSNHTINNLLLYYYNFHDDFECDIWFSTFNELKIYLSFKLILFTRLYYILIINLQLTLYVVDTLINNFKILRRKK